MEPEVVWELKRRAVEDLCRRQGWVFEPHEEYVDVRIRHGAVSCVSVGKSGHVVPTTGFQPQTRAGPVAGSDELPELSAVVVPMVQDALARVTFVISSS